MEDMQVYLQEEGVAAVERVRRKILAAGTNTWQQEQWLQQWLQLHLQTIKRFESSMAS